MDTANRIIKKLNTIQNLPTLPAVVQKLAEMVRDPNSDAKKIAALIEDDPAIMARILKVVNSALYAGTETVTSVQHAVARMGMRTVSNIAMTTSVFSAFAPGEGSVFSREKFWEHSISCGIACAVVYDRTKTHLSIRLAKDELRLAGLLHDIGKIVLDQFFHDDFMTAAAVTAEENLSLHDAERKVMGTDHSEVGAWLGRKWNLSESILGVIEWHHDPEKAGETGWETAAICHIANYICNYHKIGDGGDLAAPSYLSGIWKKLGLSVADISDVVDAVDEESKKSEILMAFV